MTEAATLFQLSDCACEGLLIPAWEIQAKQGWCVYGRNGSGKQLIDQLLVGELAPRVASTMRTLMRATSH